MVDELRDDVASTRLLVAEPGSRFKGRRGILATYSPECVELHALYPLESARMGRSPLIRSKREAI
jgi:hypothetical protein